MPAAKEITDFELMAGLRGGRLELGNSSRRFGHGRFARIESLGEREVVAGLSQRISSA